MYLLQPGEISVSEPKGQTPHLYALTGGRPLGGKFDAQGNLFYADASRGLCVVEAGSRKAILLAASVSEDSPLEPGTSIDFADDVDVSSDGTVYFTDACNIPPAKVADRDYDTLGASRISAFVGPTGRVLSYNPATGKTHVLATGLWFANGIALSEDETYLAVASSFSNRVYRLWIKGVKAGSMEPLANIPGVPDGVSAGSNRTFWVAVVSPTPPIWFHIAGNRFARWAATQIPEASRQRSLAGVLAALPQPFSQRALLMTEGLARPDSQTIPLTKEAACSALAPRLFPARTLQASGYSMVVQISENGEVLRCLHDPKTPRFVSSVTEFEGRLYLGSLRSESVYAVDIDKLPPLASSSS
eukprot:CAMPEP_0177619900 /NCGR_PEP_ID=MMETSP0419_2-20121207/26554_1 /TAXON_ID=582737 /ORGANISM="Tetraselmis sp., Strain GSL018" /LENGTH=358 /DNA_ID=CAMNT_0019119293 /DNA_START=370 /DNA_END=1448 /DNA_ORIENTATION=+